MMRDISWRRAVRLGWDEVRGIVSDEIKDILGFQIQCRINVIEGSFWDVMFVDRRLPLPKLCQLLQVTQATPEDWEDALPGEGGVDVNGIGIMLAEKLIGRHLNLTWKHHLITEDSLWLIDAAERKDQESRTFSPIFDHDWRKKMKVQAYIHSLKDQEHDRHVLGEAEIIRQIGDNLYLAEVNGVRCTAIFNPFAGRYFVDDVYGIRKEGDNV